jgi:hypothetical protein
MTRLVFGAALALMLGAPLIVFSHDAAFAEQQRATCSQARTACGTRRICQERYEECLRSGCWAVPLVKRCGYAKQ